MTYALVAEHGRVKHVAVWHPTGRGAASLCRRWDAPRMIADDGTWLGLTVKFHTDPAESPLPWCRFCTRQVTEMAADVLGN